MPTPFRRAVEQRSAVVLIWLRSMPQWLPFLAVLALVLGGLLAPAALGAVLLLVVFVLLVWLVFLSWPALAASARLIRILALAVVLGAVIQRVRGH